MSYLTNFVLQQENDLLLLLLEKLYHLRRAYLTETSEAVRFQLKKHIAELEREKTRIEQTIQHIDQAYTQQHKHLIQDIEQFLRN